MTTTPIKCPHGRSVAFDVDGMTMYDLVPEAEFCGDCEKLWNAGINPLAVDSPPIAPVWP